MNPKFGKPHSGFIRPHFGSNCNIAAGNPTKAAEPSALLRGWRLKSVIEHQESHFHVAIGQLQCDVTSEWADILSDQRTWHDNQSSASDFE